MEKIATEKKHEKAKDEPGEWDGLLAWLKVENKP